MERPTEDVVVVRIYLQQDQNRREVLLRRLRDWGKVRGATFFHGVQGFGAQHEGSSEPLVIEFFESADKVEEALDLLGDVVDPGHVVYWPARLR